MYHDRTVWRCAIFVGKKHGAKDIHKEMLPMYSEHCMSRQAIHNWVQRFSEGWTSIKDEHRAHAESHQQNFTPQVSRDL
jgi:hypothetical protein